MDNQAIVKAEQVGGQLARAAIIVHLADGTILQGTAELRTSALPNTKSTAVKLESRAASTSPTVDFSIPVRPFIKRYGGKLSSGPKRLTLLVARLSGGKTDVEIARSEVEKNWSKMEALLGGRYNGAYDTRARDEGWIYSPKPGVFALRNGWEAILR